MSTQKDLANLTYLDLHRLHALYVDRSERDLRRRFQEGKVMHVAVIATGIDPMSITTTFG